MIDYLIVGAGLGGIAFAETAINNGKSVYVFDNDLQGSSRTAAGVYNPVILKRFSGLSNAQEQLDKLQGFYASLKVNKGIDTLIPMPILRKFASFEEQNNWFIAADKSQLAPFLSTTLVKSRFEGISSGFGFGEVLQTGYVDTETLISKYHDYLISRNSFSDETFDYSLLDVKEESLMYKDKQVCHVVFAEGFAMLGNPFFNYLPLNGTKGEILVIKSAGLKLDAIIKAGVFILPLGNDHFKVGATYNWEDKSEMPTKEGREELEQKVREVLDCGFEVVDHKAAIRPTVKDRKPLIGTHPIYKRLHILNGLGTRGVMLGPAMAHVLYEHIESNVAIDRDISIERFRKLFSPPPDRNS